LRWVLVPEKRIKLIICRLYTKRTFKSKFCSLGLFWTFSDDFGRIKNMIITYYGMSCFKVALGDRVLAFNPPSKDSKFKTPRFGAEIVLSSLNHPDYNGYESLTDEAKDTLHIYGPGEYEAGGIFIKGVGVAENIFGQEKHNSVYSVIFDDINLCHLGALSSKELSADAKEAIGAVDILFVPITGGDLLTPSDATKMASVLEAKIVIPISHTITGEDSKSLSLFLKEIGQESVKPLDKLTIKKKDLEGQEGSVVVLTPIF